ncbi:MAG: alpha/beta hydrolase [Chloroflexi bacterium]|nr:alpha/beta hydrolase [Chloroflexota bacterium]
MKKFLVLVIVVVLVSACSGGPSTNSLEPTQVTEIAQATDTLEPAPTPTPIPPTEPPPPGPTPEPTLVPFEETLDVPYVADGDYKQKLDLYLPSSGDGPFPTLFVIHGGGDNKRDMAPLTHYFAERGYAAISIDHRDMPYAKYPLPVQDTFCAMAWTHANASTYGLDSGQIFAAGHSSGGTLVTMLGVVDDPAPFMEGCPHTLPEGNLVRGVATFTGVFDYVRAADFSSGLYHYIVDYLGGEADEIPDIWAEASPATWVDGSEPPFILVDGASDGNISPNESTEFATTLEQAGVDVKLELVDGASHGDIIRSEYFDIVETFVAALVEK